MRESRIRRRVRWHRVRWLLPLVLGASWMATTAAPALIAAARDHQVRAYFSPPPPTPSEWRPIQPQPIGVDELVPGSAYPGGARR